MRKGWVGSRRNHALTLQPFAEGVWMHRLLDGIVLSSDTGRQVAVSADVKEVKDAA